MRGEAEIDSRKVINDKIFRVAELIELGFSLSEMCAHENVLAQYQLPRPQYAGERP